MGAVLSSGQADSAEELPAADTKRNRPALKLPPARSQSQMLPSLLGNEIGTMPLNSSSRVHSGQKKGAHEDRFLYAVNSFSEAFISVPFLLAGGFIGGFTGLAGDVGESLLDCVPGEERLGGPKWNSESTKAAKVAVAVLFAGEERV